MNIIYKAYYMHKRHHVGQLTVPQTSIQSRASDDDFDDEYPNPKRVRVAFSSESSSSDSDSESSSSESSASSEESEIESHSKKQRLENEELPDSNDLEVANNSDYNFFLQLLPYPDLIYLCTQYLDYKAYAAFTLAVCSSQQLNQLIKMNNLYFHAPFMHSRGMLFPYRLEQMKQKSRYLSEQKKLMEHSFKALEAQSTNQFNERELAILEDGLARTSIYEEHNIPSKLQAARPLIKWHDDFLVNVNKRITDLGEKIARLEDQMKQSDRESSMGYNRFYQQTIKSLYDYLRNEETVNPSDFWLLRTGTLGTKIPKFQFLILKKNEQGHYKPINLFQVPKNSRFESFPINLVDVQEKKKDYTHITPNKVTFWTRPRSYGGKKTISLAELMNYPMDGGEITLEETHLNCLQQAFNKDLTASFLNDIVSILKRSTLCSELFKHNDAPDDAAVLDEIAHQRLDIRDVFKGEQSLTNVLFNVGAYLDSIATPVQDLIEHFGYFVRPLATRLNPISKNITFLKVYEFLVFISQYDHDVYTVIDDQVSESDRGLYLSELLKKLKRDESPLFECLDKLLIELQPLKNTMGALPLSTVQVISKICDTRDLAQELHRLAEELRPQFQNVGELPLYVVLKIRPLNFEFQHTLDALTQEMGSTAEAINCFLFNMFMHLVLEVVPLEETIKLIINLAPRCSPTQLKRIIDVIKPYWFEKEFFNKHFVVHSQIIDQLEAVQPHIVFHQLDSRSWTALVEEIKSRVQQQLQAQRELEAQRQFEAQRQWQRQHQLEAQPQRINYLEQLRQTIDSLTEQEREVVLNGRVPQSNEPPNVSSAVSNPFAFFNFIANVQNNSANADNTINIPEIHDWNFFNF